MSDIRNDLLDTVDRLCEEQCTRAVLVAAEQREWSALRAAGWWVGGIHAVCTQQAQHFGPDSLSIFEIAPTDTRLRRFVERHIAPCSAWTDVRWRSQKVLACDKVDP
jgi:hypothetical protein